MNWKQLCSGILLGSLASLFALPSQAQDTTGQLNQAICIEDWEGAIAILYSAILDYPDSNITLQQYTDRVQQLSTTGLSERQKAQYCSPELSTLPNPTSEETPLTILVNGYYEEIGNYYRTHGDISYEEVTNILQLPGKIANLDSRYTWQTKDDTYISATFANNELTGLLVPAEFERLLERFEVGMKDRAVLQSMVRELGEPSSQRELVVYVWQFQEGEMVCTLSVDFSNDEFSGTGYDCGILPEF
ncbi:hypothetical protein JJD41_19370 [Oxynema sp. CENA135]|uniref:hypothetical protein n=1 Tax=Oxynema sp. CENA135 TaxID=984206 RepID=UPI00190CD820|nr:hypothetical protein [Oxynema sp. CENA135]MBK4732013.1 hypothetical protein [Oxynema sp. CENA135]